MKVIAMSNRKGGVGKTTMAVHLGSGLATLGYRVGLVDADSQGHVAVMLNMPKENGLFRLMIEKAPLSDVVQEVAAQRYSTPDHPAQGTLYMIPSDETTYKIPYKTSETDGFLFLDLMDSFGEQYALDYIIVDTNPTMSMFDGAIYLATDGFIYVTQCEVLSFDGVVSAIEQMQVFQKTRRRYLNRDSRVLGIIPNMFRADTILHRQNISELAEAFPGLVWSPIRLRIAWGEAVKKRQLLFTSTPSSGESHDIWEMIDRMLKEVEIWQSQSANN